MNNNINNLKRLKSSLQNEFKVIQNGMTATNLSINMVNKLTKFITDGELFIQKYYNIRNGLITRTNKRYSHRNERSWEKSC